MDKVHIHRLIHSIHEVIVDGSCLELEIGMDCLNNAAIALGVSLDSENLVTVTKKALEMHEEVKQEVMLAAIHIHPHDASLNSFVREIGSV